MLGPRGNLSAPTSRRPRPQTNSSGGSAAHPPPRGTTTPPPPKAAAPRAAPAQGLSTFGRLPTALPRSAGLTGDLGLGHAAEAEALGPIQLPDLGAAPRLAAAVTASRGGGDTQQPKSPREETHPSPLAPPPAVRRAKPRSRGGEAAGVPGAARCRAGRRGVRPPSPGSLGGTARSGRGRQAGEPRVSGAAAACGEGAGEFNPDARRGSAEGAEIQVWPGRAGPGRFKAPERDRVEGFCS